MHRTAKIGPTQMLCCFALLAIILAGASATILPERRDVCIIGGGIGGMSMATFLKDRGFSSIVIEKEEMLGGQCRSVYFPHNGDEYHIDTGPIAFYNTTAIAFPGWIDIAAFFSRFAEIGPVPISFDIPTVNVDLATGETVEPLSLDPVVFAELIERYFTALAPYPWMITWTEPPVQVPPELTVTFQQWLIDNQLVNLTSFLKILTNAGFTNYSELTALDGIRTLSGPTGGMSFFAPSGSFAVNDGCYALYEGMTDYLGASNILTNARITEVRRPPLGLPYHVRVTGRRQPSNRRFSYTCDHLVLAVPPEPGQVDFMDFDMFENSLYSDVDHRWYYVSAVDVEGPIAAADFALINYDVTDPFGMPPAPAVFQIFRGYPFGPAVMSASANQDTPLDQLIPIWKGMLDNIPDSLLTRVNISRPVSFHRFLPHFSPDTLNAPVSPYHRLQARQGVRRTYTNTVLDTFASHSAIINRAHKLAQSFPSKLRSVEDEIVTPVVKGQLDVAAMTRHAVRWYTERHARRA